MTGSGRSQRIIVQIEKQTLFDVMNEGIRSGDIELATANY
jgi:hypothetical protein